jgi:iron complex transport system ATP-binding protein
MIEVKDLSYTIAGKTLLSGIDLKVAPGEMLAILGANGAGKSTLMKLLSREILPGSGSILIHGKEMKSYGTVELAKIRGVLAQHNTISMAFKVHELVLMGRYPHFESRPSAHDFEVVRMVMEETGVTHLSERDYNTLSGGEQQRVQLARVLSQIYDVKNGLLFLDEPINGLDMRYQQQILTIGNFASRYADNILILKNGRAVDYGSPLQVINCETIHEAFNIRVKLLDCDDQACPLVIPGTDYIKIGKQQ